MDVADIAKEDSMLGSWPRRLLHIPSMTSYEWQPGNKYGPHTNPAYNAITYTWGRWRLLASQQPSVTPIRITGIPWEVPRVDPAHFTVNQLEAVLLKVQTGAMTAYKKKPVLIDFVWLDIACIDQRESERRSAAEVGRQAKIFHGAHNVFIWFSQTSIMELNTIVKKLDEPNEYLGGLSRRDTDKTQLPSMLGQLHQNMTQLFRDPWFSSLWTLQEAFLRQDAVMLSKEALFLNRATENPALSSASSYNFMANEVFDDCVSLSRLSREKYSLPEPYGDIVELAKKTGLTGILTQNAMAAYTAAAGRKTTTEQDRIYAIQQMFGFRLGATNTNLPLKPSYSLEELEDQLGEQLLGQYPVLSQIHVFTEPADDKKRWRISQKSVVPDLSWIGDNAISPSMSDQHVDDVPLVRFNVKRVAGKNRGYFIGKLCSFYTLRENYIAKEQAPPFSEELAECNFLVLHMDVCPELCGSPEYRGNGYRETPLGDRQRSLSNWFCRAFDNQRLKVLLLGSMTSQAARDSAMAGLVLLQTRPGGGLAIFGSDSVIGALDIRT